ncbi:hypothetical protein F441_18438 [Phytophthora nicotianae CJ01A1]|uniref:Uncharacterized protein n=6 Tax=Phytophthora nicotianae TaxID=4792 RepID=W2PMA8_PHYN3|nr:hypothetical protein PPTG_24084 [Phytophthora nicotianae INRA-310]XP_008913294.1 hypothetical protein PPTG_24085 [Phytophthora nicotianae INRA-310]ETI35020.1 hypothetical protein F443_18569 [Phytophthora nicotianae P1569]ETK75297.1 hypothetical protein L915_18056 [Phytophthora nicotianae]ETO63777.1 hypothetical protein F444_18571 [Phytophthora nicotianae P1976]ETP04851.1 hypothetical protein F441_18438 [Phytophthora nicotianae CJ01A1]ETP33011.1 hypothetical protein F442_18378 [Phytophthora
MWLPSNGDLVNLGKYSYQVGYRASKMEIFGVADRNRSSVTDTAVKTAGAPDIGSLTRSYLKH